eukprot:c3730_g1_i1.p1 GENE.c3730_g1_i1~~c3730_g1_i1.p1  ORF type:complete len:909 (+),score=272.55 c3730_g1_i1:343-2727(+)
MGTWSPRYGVLTPTVFVLYANKETTSAPLEVISISTIVHSTHTKSPNQNLFTFRVSTVSTDIFLGCTQEEHSKAWCENIRKQTHHHTIEHIFVPILHQHAKNGLLKRIFMIDIKHGIFSITSSMPLLNPIKFDFESITGVTTGEAYSIRIFLQEGKTETVICASERDHDLLLECLESISKERRSFHVPAHLTRTLLPVQSGIVDMLIVGGLWIRRRIECSSQRRLLIYASGSVVPEHILDVSECTIIPTGSKNLLVFQACLNIDGIFLRFTTIEDRNQWCLLLSPRHNTLTCYAQNLEDSRFLIDMIVHKHYVAFSSSTEDEDSDGAHSLHSDAEIVPESTIGDDWQDVPIVGPEHDDELKIEISKQKSVTDASVPTWLQAKLGRSSPNVEKTPDLVEFTPHTHIATLPVELEKMEYSPVQRRKEDSGNISTQQTVEESLQTHSFSPQVQHISVLDASKSSVESPKESHSQPHETSVKPSPEPHETSAKPSPEPHEHKTSIQTPIERHETSTLLESHETQPQEHHTTTAVSEEITTHTTIDAKAPVTIDTPTEPEETADNVTSPSNVLEGAHSIADGGNGNDVTAIDEEVILPTPKDSKEENISPSVSVIENDPILETNPAPDTVQPPITLEHSHNSSILESLLPDDSVITEHSNDLHVVDSKVTDDTDPQLQTGNSEILIDDDDSGSSDGIGYHIVNPEDEEVDELEMMLRSGGTPSLPSKILRTSENDMTSILDIDEYVFEENMSNVNIPDTPRDVTTTTPPIVPTEHTAFLSEKIVETSPKSSDDDEGLDF